MALSRRTLFQGSLLAAPSLSWAGALARAAFFASPAKAQVSAAPKASAPPSEGYIVRAGESRAGKPWTAGGEPHFWLKIGGGDSSGRVVVLEVTTPVNAGPPLHTHPGHNEFMYLLAGTFGIEVAGKRSILKAGDCFMAPKGVPHRYLSLGPEIARHLNVCDPADDVEEFFATYEVQHGPNAPQHNGPPPMGPPLKRSDFDNLR